MAAKKKAASPATAPKKKAPAKKAAPAKKKETAPKKAAPKKAAAPAAAAEPTRTLDPQVQAEKLLDALINQTEEKVRRSLWKRLFGRS